MTTLLDPWTHAQEIAQRLRSDASRLVVLLGAESWCGRCRALRPIFDDRARRAASHEVWLWLDMEEHDEFIGGFIPDDMPLLLVYRAGQIAHAEIASVIALDRVLKGEESSTIVHAVPEHLIARLLAENWQPTVKEM